jgi:hypothetical protein
LAKPNYQYEKRQRELAKKAKKAEKAARKATPGNDASDGSDAADVPAQDTGGVAGAPEGEAPKDPAA